MPRITINYRSYSVSDEEIERIQRHPYMTEDEKKTYIKHLKRDARKRTRRSFIGGVMKQVLLFVFIMILLWIGQQIAGVL